MQDAHSVITHATSGHVPEMAREMEVSERRMYEMLGSQCVYPKSKRLIRVIGKFNRVGVRLIKADMDSMFADILGESPVKDVTVATLHEEAFEAIDSVLKGKTAAEQKQQLRELIAVCQIKITGIDQCVERSNGFVS